MSGRRQKCFAILLCIWTTETLEKGEDRKAEERQDQHVNPSEVLSTNQRVQQGRARDADGTTSDDISKIVGPEVPVHAGAKSVNPSLPNTVVKLTAHSHPSETGHHREEARIASWYAGSKHKHRREDRGTAGIAGGH